VCSGASSGSGGSGGGTCSVSVSDEVEARIDDIGDIVGSDVVSTPFPEFEFDDWGGSCSASDYLDRAYRWTPPSTGTWCIENTRSDWKTILTVFQSCDEAGSYSEESCSGSPSYGGNVEYTATTLDSIVIGVDFEAVSPGIEHMFRMTIREGGCP